VLGFTAADDNPVCCIIILAGSELKANHIMGIQLWVEVDGDVCNVQRNSLGLDKYSPCGPKCTHLGCEIDTSVTISENGSIGTEILMLAMQHLDTSMELDWLEATAFLLLDGRGSCFGLNFLRYIKTIEMKWIVCKSVPYGTHLWQVGDSSEQNGAFEQALTRQKQVIISEKSKLHLPGKVEKQDIVGLMHYAWNKSFAYERISKQYC
jgi:hypothetical protein